MVQIRSTKKTIISSTLLIAIATTASFTLTAGAQYKATCLYDDAKCDGSIKVRYYESDDSCKTSSCSQVTLGGSSDFAQFVLCPTDIAADAASLLAGRSYVLVQEYKGDGCTGEPEEATAVVADGNCYPQVDGESSFMVSVNADKSASWVFYDGTPDCKGEKNETMFAATDTDGTKCVDNKFRVVTSLVDSPDSSVKATSAWGGVCMTVLTTAAFFISSVLS